MSIDTLPVAFARGQKVTNSPARTKQILLNSRRRRLKLSLLVCSLLATAGLAYGGWVVKSISDHLPSVDSIADVRLNAATTILSSDGVILATLESQRRRPVALEQIAPDLQAATIATEDSRFYEHNGIDPRGIFRALFANLRDGNSTSQGGSTLTQQLARSLYLTSEKTYRRKIAEMLLARRIEERYGKRQILEAYLNTAYYGNGAYGVEAAANTYFGKPAAKLTLGEAALLAGLPQRPIAFSPTQHLDAALRRRKLVLVRMVATGRISESQAKRAEADIPRILNPRNALKVSGKAPYFVNDVVRILREKYGLEMLYSGAKIVTTLNWKMQRAAEESLRRGLPGGEGPNTGAIVAIDARTGAVRALVGGADFQRDQFDAVTQGIRQPGSAFKPFVYAAAFDSSACDLSTVIDDKPISYRSSSESWKVHNYDGRYRGGMTALDGLRLSVNTIAVQVMEKVGPANVVDYAQRMGIGTPLTPVLPLALGASGVHPIDICSAYSAFANGGERYDPLLVQSIDDANGREIFRDDSESRRHSPVLSPQALDQINVGLRETVINGTAAAAASIPDAHGKTGTTSSHRDAWFIGYDRDLSVAVWTAHVRKESVLQGKRRVSLAKYLPMGNATGGAICAPIWRNFMALAQPEQRRINLARRITDGVIAAPETKTLLAALRQQASDAAQELAQSDPVDPQKTEVAENGSVAVPIVAPAGTAASVPESDEARVEQPDDAAVAPVPAPDPLH